MAATDKPYRTQHTLDIVFAVSSLAMLLSIIWMFADDYYRPFKTEQRSFREIEAAIAQRQAIDLIPDRAEFEAKRKAFEAARDEYTADATKASAAKKSTLGLMSVNLALESRQNVSNLPQHRVGKMS